jgi:hypothetical protein
MAIAAYVCRQGAAYSGEILARFDISPTTLRRRRPELSRLGIVFVDRGGGSFYVTAELAGQLPSSCRAQAPETVDELPDHLPATYPQNSGETGDRENGRTPKRRVSSPGPGLAEMEF